MKTEHWLQTLERFFLDVVGTLVPGVILVVPILHALKGSLPSVLLVIPPTEAFEWTVLIITCYAAGHLVTSVAIRGGIIKEKRLVDQIGRGTDYKFVVHWARLTFPGFEPQPSLRPALHQLRSLCMSIIGPSDRQTVYRFMFIALFNFGVATSLVLLLFGSSLLLVNERLLNTFGTRISVSPWVGMLVVAVPFFVERGRYFYGIAMRLPFSMLLGRLARDRFRSVNDPSTRVLAAHSGDYVYLAGGFHSGWQDVVTAACPDLKFLDPRQHRLQEASAFTAWDLDAIRRSRFVLAYLEASNPGGYALALEVGFAKALDKRVILIDEKSRADDSAAEHLRMIRAVADVVTDNLEDGKKALIELGRLWH